MTESSEPDRPESGDASGRHAMSGQEPSGGSETGRRVVSLVTTALLLLGPTGLGSLLIEFPPTLPKGIQNWLAFSAGAVLLTIAAIVATFFRGISKWIYRKLGYFPAWFKKNTAELRRPRKIAALIASLIAVVLVAWLVPKPATTALEPGDLTLLSALDESPSDPRRILINQWNETHPDNKVKVIDAPGEPDQQHDRMVNDAKAKGQQEADIYLLDNVWMAEFIQNEYIQPLDQSRRTSQDADYFRNVLDTCKDMYGGKPGLWALPLNADAGLMFYRSGLEGVDEPTSWDDYFGTAAGADLVATRRPELAQAAVPLQFANAAQLADEEVLTVTAFEAIWAAEGEVVNRDGRPILNADRTAVEFDGQARQGIRNLAAAYKNRDITAVDASDADEAKAIAQFKEGRALYMRNWPVTYDRLKSSTDRPTVPFEVGALPGDSVLGGQNLAISKSTERPRAAQALMEFLTSPSSQLILFEVGGFAPTRPLVYSDASSITRTYADELRNSIEDARPRPLTPRYIEFSREFRLGVTRALRNNGEFEPDFLEKLAVYFQVG